MTSLLVSVANRTPNASTKTSVGAGVAFVPICEKNCGWKLATWFSDGCAAYSATVFGGAVPYSCAEMPFGAAGEAVACVCRSLTRRRRSEFPHGCAT